MDKSINKKFWKYVIPSMFTCLLSGIYCLVDGLFIGQAVGDAGLAGINIAWPIAALILAIGTGIGIGGSVVMSNYLGRNQENKAKLARGNTIVLLIIAALALTIIIYSFIGPILRMLGAADEVYDAALIYCKIFVLGSIFQLLGTGFTPLLRNMGHVMFAMVIMILGFVTNIVLDYILIISLNMGMAGAALATVTGQALVVIASIFIMFNKKNRIDFKKYKLDLSIVTKIFRIGLSPLGLSLSPSIIIIFANWQCIKYGGNIAVAAYAVLSYVMSTAQLLVQGVGDGSQPLISYYKGAKQLDIIHYIRRKTINLAVIIGIVTGAIIIAMKTTIPQIFGASAEASVIIANSLPIFTVAFPLMAISRTSSAYFYGIQHANYASILVYLEPLAITPLCMLILPLIFNLNGVWLAMPVTQGFVVLTALILYTHSDKILKTEIASH